MNPAWYFLISPALLYFGIFGLYETREQHRRFHPDELAMAYVLFFIVRNSPVWLFLFSLGLIYAAFACPIRALFF